MRPARSLCVGELPLHTTPVSPHSLLLTNGSRRPLHLIGWCTRTLGSDLIQAARAVLGPFVALQLLLLRRLRRLQTVLGYGCLRRAACALYGELLHKFDVVDAAVVGGTVRDHRAEHGGRLGDALHATAREELCPVQPAPALLVRVLAGAKELLERTCGGLADVLHALHR